MSLKQVLSALALLAVVSCSDGGADSKPAPSSTTATETSRIAFSILVPNEEGSDPDPAVEWSADTEIHVMGADGGDLTRLTDNSFGEINLGWSPDGTKIAAAEGVADDKLRVVNADGSGETTVGGWSTCGVTLDWSADSSKIVLTACPPARSYASLFVVDVDGSGRKRLTQDQPSFDPDWSPDGRQIAFASAGKTKGIWVMTSEGGLQTRLTFDDDFGPRWSSDGARIAFIRGSDPMGIFVMNPDGTGLERLTTDLASGDQIIAWSPNSSEIAFADSGGIVVVDADSGVAKRLSPSGVDDYHPSWSPDGTMLTFSNSLDNEVYVMAADGSQRKRLTHTGGHAYGPYWSQAG